MAISPEQKKHGVILAGSLIAQESPTWEQTCDLVVPKKSELVAETIPWLPTFKDGALRAADRDRPILLWAMNGHPLGCT